MGRAARLAAPVAFVSALLAPASAGAQEWLKDRRFSEGPGYKAGDFELHPGLGGEVGYDSNYFLRTNKTGPTIVNGAPAAPVAGAGLLRITPSLSLSTAQSAQRVEGIAKGELPKFAVQAEVSGTYREFIGTQELRDQRNFSANAGARVDILPGAPWGGAVYGNYVRTIQPTVIGSPDLSFNRDDLGAGGEVIAQPNSGTLDWRVGYQIHGALFESSNGAPYSNTTHEINTRGRWKFRPRTALLYDGTLRFNSYANANRATTALHDSSPVRARLGISGLITPRVAILAMGGWASSFYRGGTGNPTVKQYDGPIGQAQVTFFPNASPQVTGDAHDATLTLSSIGIGYSRDYVGSYLGNFYGSDRGYAKIAYFFAGRALISLEGGVGAVEYPDIFANGGPGAAASVAHTSFTDVRVDGTLFAEYRLLDSLGLNTTIGYQQNFSQAQIPLGSVAGAPALVYDLNWQRFQAFIGARWFM